MNRYYSCVYVIRSRIRPERCYVGSAVDFGLRVRRHIRDLRSGRHFNAKLQRHVKKYGILDIYFEKLEKCSPGLLLILEQKYIDKYQPFFNICKIAGSRLYTRHSQTSINRMKQAFKRRPPIPIASRLFGSGVSKS